MVKENRTWSGGRVRRPVSTLRVGWRRSDTTLVLWCLVLHPPPSRVSNALGVVSQVL